MISVLMSCFNKEQYVGAAIESVLGQSDGDLELIVVDDCSADRSKQVVRQYMGDRRVRLVEHTRNMGMGAATRSAADSAVGSLMGLLDADDVLDKTAVATMKAAHAKRPDAGLIYSSYWRCDANLNPGPDLWPSARIPDGFTLLEHMDEGGHMVVGPFRTFTREAYWKTSGFGTQRGSQDLDIALKIEEVAPLVFVDERLYYYRILPTSMAASRGGPNLMAQIQEEAYARRGLQVPWK
jgi:glycosyltransferase involved in cell wall biosynthesis